MYYFDKVFLGKTAAFMIFHDGCVTCAYSFSFGNQPNNNKERKRSDSDHLHAVLTLKASLSTARSENGFIHVWNLKTHRVDTALDGHGRKSVYCVQTMGGKDRLLRLAKQAKPSEIILVCVIYSCLCDWRKKRGGWGHKGFSWFWSHLKVFPTHMEKYWNKKDRKILE